ncbi:LuxR C-terminal-related transcriptional regulator [Saccharopolyspora sp. NPDC000359]|uniref:LuxR C-terminal-related transcriptional regulator n=1 Tax=Saccharopolyspora sp. NPDC000359 TaxID=3154251 RepID=UPI0033183163
MIRASGAVVGRDDERAALAESIRRRIVVEVRGGAGDGRSALLDAACADWGRDAVPVVKATASREKPLATVDALLDSIRERFGQTACPRLLDSIATAAELRSGFRAGDDVLAIAHGIGRALAQAVSGPRGGVAVIDDVDRADAVSGRALATIAETACSAGASVVFSACRGRRTPLDALVSETIELAPLSDTDIRTVLDRRMPRFPLDMAVIEALRTALGPLFHNPGTVLPTLLSLMAERRLVVVDERWCLTGRGEEIAVSADHRWVRPFRRNAAGAALVAMLAARTPLALEHLPGLVGVLGADLGETGLLLDELVEAGAIEFSEPGGSASFAAPALAAAARALADGELVDECRVFLAHQWRTGDRGRREAAASPTPGPGSPRALRDHVRSQVAAAKFDDLHAELRRRISETIATAKDREHSDRPVLDELLTTWIGALLHEWRTDLLPEVVADLRAAGVPLPEGFAESLVESVSKADWQVVAARLRALSESRTMTAELFASLGDLTGDHESFLRTVGSWSRLRRTAADDLREAATHVDLATILERTLGVRYESAEHSDVADYQRMLRAYQAGDRERALSLARRMEARDLGRRASPMRCLSRALAGEICASVGDFGRAAEWLRGSSHRMLGGHLVSWARCGLGYRTGRTEAIGIGWREYHQHRGWGRASGLEKLLGRLIDCSTREGDQTMAETLLGELEQLDREVLSGSTRTAVLLAHGLVRHDQAKAVECVRLAQARGDEHSMARACLLLSDLSDDPQPWLAELYALTERHGSSRTRANLVGEMRRRGVWLPRQRSRDDSNTRIEARVAQLVSDGCTNRQIAAVLEVSEKTVESHLTRIFARTGCRTRVELAAAWLEGRVTETTA